MALRDSSDYMRGHTHFGGSPISVDLVLERAVDDNNPILTMHKKTGRKKQHAKNTRRVHVWRGNHLPATFFYQPPHYPSRACFCPHTQHRNPPLQLSQTLHGKYFSDQYPRHAQVLFLSTTILDTPCLLSFNRSTAQHYSALPLKNITWPTGSTATVTPRA